MTRLACTLVLLLTTASAFAAETSSKRAWKKRWLLSCAALAAVNFLDIHSSRGLREANPLLRDPSGRFATGKAVLIKGGITGGFLALQYGVTRAHSDKDYFKPFTVANTVAAGSLGAVAIRNYSLPGSLAQRP
jgi:hypothetical protein